MKKRIIAVFAVILIGSGIIVSHFNAASNEPEVEDTQLVTIDDQTQTEISSDIEQQFASIPILNADQQIPTSDLTYLYFYQPDCSNCDAIESDIVNFYNHNLGSNQEFYRVDLSQEANQNIWSDQQSEVGQAVSKVSDLKVIGTPTLVTVKDDKIESIVLGSDDTLAELK